MVNAPNGRLSGKLGLGMRGERDRGLDILDVETPSPGYGTLNIPADNRGYVAAQDEHDGVDAHVQTSLVREEKIGHNSIAQTSWNSAKEAV